MDMSSRRGSERPSKQGRDSMEGNAEGSGDGKGENANRACNACRRMKIRCVDKDNPPCRRCKGMSLECSFDPSQADREPKSRIDMLESQMANVLAKVDGIANLLGRLVPDGPVTQALPQTPVTAGMGIDRSPIRTTPSAMANSVRWMDDPPHNTATYNLSSLDYRTSDIRRGGIPPILDPDDSHTSDPPTSDDDDPLAAAVRMQPLSTLTNREEAARLRFEGHADTRVNTGSSVNSGPRKRSHGEADAEGDRLVRRKGDLSRSFLDPVQMGYCTEAQGRTLYAAFFRHSHPFMPVMDPDNDSWEDLRARSAFCTTVILLVASQVADADRPPSTLTAQCRQAAETMAKVTLFSPVSHFETVQAMVILACWSDVVWRPACHAMTLAVDMDMHRCLPTLHKTNMGAGKTGEALERDRPLVIGARIWLALTKLAFEVGYNHARPIAFVEDNILQLARGLLKHPLSRMSDSRFVVSVELLACRQFLFRPFDLTTASERTDIQEKVKAVNATVEGLYSFWVGYYNSVGVDDDNFFVKELKSQRAYAAVRTNSLVLHGIRDKHDVFLLSDERRESLKAVLQSATFLVSSIGSGGQAKNSEYGNHYFHLAIIAMARMLIRLVGLAPTACDPRQIGEDIEKLISSLPRFPGYSFISLLKNDLLKARREGTFPWPNTPQMVTNSVSPDQLGILDFGSLPWLPATTAQQPSAQGGGVNLGFSWMNDMDFSQSFAPSLGLPVVGEDPSFLASSFDLQDLFGGALGNSWTDNNAGQGSS